MAEWHKSRTKNFKRISFLISIWLILSCSLFPVMVFAQEQVNSVESIERIAGADRYETAVKVSQQGWITSDTVILAAGMNENLVDSLTAAPLAKMYNAPILLTSGTDLNAVTENELKRLGAKKVYVTSGTSVISPSVINKVKGLGIETVSLGGKDRFETAVNIAKLFPKPRQIFVTSAYSNVDALSVASIAASKGNPILLVAKDSMPAAISTYLNTIKADMSNSYVIGGEGVISNSVKNLFPKAERVSGSDRYATNIEILKKFKGSLKHGNVYLASGNNQNLVDALALAPLAGKNSYPVLLTGHTLSQASKNYASLHLSSYPVVLGGENVIASSTVRDLTVATTYAVKGATIGSEDKNSPQVMEGNVRITADNVTLKNMTVKSSVYIKGNNCTLDNVKVSGTVFVDPGQEGNVTLRDSTSDSLVIISGGKNSIRAINYFAYLLSIGAVTPDGQPRVELNGTSNVGGTVVNSPAILDAQSGTFGPVEIGNAAPAPTGGAPSGSVTGSSPGVELRGTFTDPVTVTGNASVSAGTNATISNLVVNPQTPNPSVTLGGRFGTVVTQGQAQLNLGTNAYVSQLNTLAPTNLNVNSGATISQYNNNGLSNTVEGTGASSVPTSGSTPSSSGGGSSDSTPLSNNNTVTSKNNGSGNPHYGITVHATQRNPANNPIISAGTSITASTTVGTFTGNLNFPAGSSYKVANAPGIPGAFETWSLAAITGKNAGDNLAADDVLLVQAQDGTLRGYYITFAPAATTGNATGSITAPSNNSYIRALTSVSGTANDGDGDTITAVLVGIKKGGAEEYLQNDGSWEVGENWFNAVSGDSFANWSYNLDANQQAGVAALNGGNVRFNLKVNDGAVNQQNNVTTMTVDTSLPLAQSLGNNQAGGTSANLYDTNDELTLTFNEPVKVSTLFANQTDFSKITLSGGGAWGTSTITANAPSNGYAATFTITLKAGVTIAANGSQDIKIAVGGTEDRAGNTNASQLTFDVPDLSLVGVAFKLQVSPAGAGATSVTGMTMPNWYVKIKDTSAGGADWGTEVQAGADGSFSVNGVALTDTHRMKIFVRQSSGIDPMTDNQDGEYDIIVGAGTGGGLTVNTVSTGDTTVTGYSIANGEMEVARPSTATQLGTANANGDSSFSVTIPSQAATTVIRVIVYPPGSGLIGALGICKLTVQ